MEKPLETLNKLNNVNYKQLNIHLDCSIELNHVQYVWGASGIGKTAFIEDYAKSRKYGFIDMYLAVLDSIDLSGLPRVNNTSQKAEFVPFGTIPLEDDHCPSLCIVFLDEIPLARPDVMNACYKLLQERQVGQYKVHKNVRFVLAGNRAKDKGNHTDIPYPLLNRGCHVELQIDVEGWLEWGGENDIHPAVLTYIKNNPSRLHAMLEGIEKYNKYGKDLAFQTNRTWHMASDKLLLAENNKYEDTVILQFISSCVGTAIAFEFFEYYKTLGVIPSFYDITVRDAQDVKLDHIQQYYLTYSTLSSVKQNYKEYKKEELMVDKRYQSDMNLLWGYIKRNVSVELQSTFASMILIKFKLVSPDAMEEIWAEDSSWKSFIWS